MAAAVGEPLSMSAEEAADAVSEVVDENMASAARAHAVEQGKDIRRRALVAFGGAAPLHAARLAEKLGLTTVIIPPGAGVGSAIGFLLAPPAYEIARSLPMRLDAFDAARVDALFQDLRAEARAVVRAAAGEAPLKEERAAYMRYAGQGHEIAVPVEDAITAEALKRGFEQVYRLQFGRIIPGMAVEIMSWSLRVAAALDRAPQKAAIEGRRAPKDRADGRRMKSVFDAAARRRLDHALVERASLSSGDRVAGPALILEPQTTTVVTARFDAAIDADGNIVLTRKASP